MNIKFSFISLSYIYVMIFISQLFIAGPTDQIEEN